MEKKKDQKKSFLCTLCKFTYKTKKWAEKCEAWCRTYKSCNVDITKHAVRKSESHI